MLQLNRSTRNEVIELLTPFMSENERKRWIFASFDSALLNDIDMEGANRAFTTKLVQTVEHRSVNNEPALCALMKTIKPELHGDVKELFENFLDRFCESPAPTLIDSQSLEYPFKHLQTAYCGSRPLWAAINQRNHQLWIQRFQRIEVFNVSQPEAVASWVQDMRIWKNIFAPGNVDAIFASDWHGNLMMFRENNGHTTQLVHEAKFSSLPFHRVVSVDEKRIAAASWDGEIAIFDVTVGQIGRFETSGLVIQLRGCQDGRIAYITDLGEVGLASPDGKKCWTWHCQHKMRDFWIVPEPSGTEDLLFLILTKDHHAIVVSNSMNPNWIQTEIGKQIEQYSYLQQGNEARLLLLLADNKLQWLSWQPLVLLDEPVVQLKETPKQIVALNIRREQSIVLTDRGELLLVQFVGYERYKPNSRVSSLLTDEERHFLFWFSDQQIDMFTLSIMNCSVELVNVDSQLKLSSYELLIIRLKNNGQLPIKSIKAELGSNYRIDVIGQTVVEKSELSLQVGEEIPLNFHIQVGEDGKVPLTLELQLENTIGIKNIQTISLVAQVGRTNDS